MGSRPTTSSAEVPSHSGQHMAATLAPATSADYLRSTAMLSATVPIQAPRRPLPLQSQQPSSKAEHVGAADARNWFGVHASTSSQHVLDYYRG